MSFRPALRRSIELVQRSDGGGDLTEPLREWSMSLDAGQLAIVRMLDGTRDLAQVARDANAQPGRVEHVVRSLLLLSLLDGAGDRIVARIDDLANGRARLATVILDETRFTCQGSGDCCRNYKLGPLRDEDVARLAALDLAGAFPHLAGQSFTEEHTTSDGRSVTYLRRDDDRCTFLDGNGHCGVHVRFGAEAKPAMCRMYPLEQLPTIVGRKIYDRGSCSTFATSARTGTPLVDEVPRLEALFGGPTELFHPVVMLDAGTPCDYGHLLALQDALCRMAAQRREQAATLRAVVRRARDFATALADCPLASGEPDATVARLCAADRDADLATPTDEEELQHGLQALQRLLERLTSIAVEAFARPRVEERGHLATARRGSELAAALHLVHTVAAHRIAPSQIAPPSLATIAADDPEHEELFRISLRQQLFGDGLLIDERLAPGLLRLGLAWLVARWTARFHAAVDGKSRIEPPHFSAGHTLANRVLLSNSLAAVFSESESDAWTILSALPSLA